MPRRPFLRRIIFGCLVLLLAGLSAGAYYVCTKGFFRPWRVLISAEFEKRGMEVSLQRLTLDPFRGLVARDVKLYDARDRRRVLATIDELLLGVNYPHAMRGGSFLEWVDLHDARVTLPLNPTQPDGPELEATKLNARFFLPAGQIYLAKAEAVIAGIQVYATGRLLNPESFPGPKAGTVFAGARAHEILETVSALKYPAGQTPVLTVEFSGDLADPDQVAIDARLEGPSIRKKNYTLSHLHATATYRHRVLELQRLVADDIHGELRATGSYDFRTDKYTVRLNSALGIKELAKAYGMAQPLEGLVLQSAPRLNLSIAGTLESEEAQRVFGHVTAEQFAFRGVPFRSLDADVSWTDGYWSVRELKLRHASGWLAGDLMERPDGFRAEVHGSINPHDLAAAITGPLADFLSRFDFREAATLALEIDGPAAAFEKCRIQGEVRFGRATFEGASVQDLTARLQCAEGTLTLAPFGPPPGENAEMTLVYNLAARNSKLEPRPMQAPDGPKPATEPESPVISHAASPALQPSDEPF